MNEIQTEQSQLSHPPELLNECRSPNPVGLTVTALPETSLPVQRESYCGLNLHLDLIRLLL